MAQLQMQNSQILTQLISQQHTTKKFDLTSFGFHYVLQDTPTQVHIILRKFLEYVSDSARFENSQEMIVELIQLIFNLTLSKFNQAYTLRSKNQELHRVVKQNFEQMGLVEFSLADKDLFFTTPLM
mmetsp:Transcript_11697/g.19749  ORF Transcript_11697/g.19749 Transcript_11697/m.19749 type:complete len:126 (+) Transcript_11697:723-1100(+)